MKKVLSCFLCLVFVFSAGKNALCASFETDNIAENTAKYLSETVKEPGISSIGGEWTVLGLARSGADVPKSYYKRYYDNVLEAVREKNGVLDERKNTEYARVALALGAIGENPADVSGYNLLLYLADFDKTVRQGINGAVWALIAIDGGDYEMPENERFKIRAAAERYLEYILTNRLSDGGWSVSGGESDVDMTAMALCALAPYKDRDEVKEAAEGALGYLSGAQEADGGFLSRGAKNSESCAQVITALASFGISPEDENFVKNGKTLIDNLMTFYDGNGGFLHTSADKTANLMATEQAFYALAAAKRFSGGERVLYDMRDAKAQVSENKTENTDILKTEIISPGKTFSDISGHKSQKSIEALAERGIINGRSGELFEPEATMTRAEFAVIVTRSLGLSEREGDVFSDVAPSDWFYGYVNAAYSYGIVSGVSKTEFAPFGKITREEAAVMTARAALLCKSGELTGGDYARDILAEFSDYVTASDWARGALAYCFDKHILLSDEMEIRPKNAILRAEIADMIYNMLLYADLI